MTVVAVVAHAAIDGLPWSASFALGAIVSPTDPLAATAIATRLGVPQRLVGIIEGESLVNDGTALVAYHSAVAAAVGGTFDLLDGGWDFAVNAAGGVACGLLAGALLAPALRHARRDPLLHVTISLVGGYLAYIPSEELGVSGVLAAVAAGLLLGRRSDQISTAAVRLSGYAFWEVLVFLVNAVLFVLVGFGLEHILEEQERSPATLAALGLAVSATVILVRLAWFLTVSYVVRAIDRRPVQRARRIPWRSRFVIGWSGMRGSVSLAAALALPAAFPERELVIFLATCVIFATLVAQGLTLPTVIRRMGVRDDGALAAQELRARRAATDAAIERLRELREEDWTRSSTVDRMLEDYEVRRRRLALAAGEDDAEEDGPPPDLEAHVGARTRVELDVIAAQRAIVVGLRDVGDVSDEVMHRIERELDLQEQRLNG
jgi:CPA1 family monovalent cation:H+ antiporter